MLKPQKLKPKTPPLLKQLSAKTTEEAHASTVRLVKTFLVVLHATTVTLENALSLLSLAETELTGVIKRDANFSTPFFVETRCEIPNALTNRVHSRI